MSELDDLDDDREVQAQPDIVYEPDDASARAIPGSLMWGSSTQLVIDANGELRVAKQLAQVSLPEPAVCTLYVQVAFRLSSVLSTDTRLSVFTLNLLQGVGRLTIPRQVTFLDQPSPDSPLEWTMPFVPLHALNVNVEAIGAGIASGDRIELEVSFQLSPITRIPQKDMPLDFGMAEPGEADSMDHEMHAELEAESPTVAQILGAGNDLEREPEPELVVPTGRQALVATVLERLTQRLGRAPTAEEARAALGRIDARRARRAQRGAAPQVPPERHALIQRIIGALEQRLGRRPSKPEVRAELDRLNRMRGAR